VKGRDVVVCLCETHWRPLRLCALQLAEGGQAVHLLLRGPITPDVLPLVPPHPRIRWAVIRRPWFKIVVVAAVAMGTLTGRYRQVLVDRARLRVVIQRWIPWVRQRCALVQADAERGFRLVSDADRADL